MSRGFTSPIFLTLALARPFISVKNFYTEFFVFFDIFSFADIGQQTVEQTTRSVEAFILYSLQKA
jgi:hypothetical protein